jgi:hypothetical protein
MVTQVVFDKAMAEIHSQMEYLCSHIDRSVQLAEERAECRLTAVEE